MDGSEPVRTYRRYERWKWYKWVLPTLIIYLLLSLTPLIYRIEPLVKAVFFLVAGWIWFLVRVAPEIHFNWAAIGLFVACYALVVAGLQWLGRSLAVKAGWTWSKRWPFGIYLGCWILFLTAMGFTGAVHQVGWLWSSGEKWIDTPVRRRLDQIVAINNAKQLGVLASGYLENLNSSLNSSGDVRTAIFDGCRPCLDDCTVLSFPEEHDAIKTILIVPRSQVVLKRFGFIRIEADGSSTQEPGNQLPETLDRLNVGQFEPVPQP
jgi:hypothetical protein